MNELIYIIYAVDVLSTMSYLARNFLGVLFIVTLILSAVSPLILEMLDVSFPTAIKYIPTKTIITTVTISIISIILIPSKQTMYTMLAVKVGGDVVTEIADNEIAGKAIQLLEQKIDEQLEQKEK